ncbi:MAG: flagellar protein export ATPase FliI [Pseudomonadota bacterium]
MATSASRQRLVSARLNDRLQYLDQSPSLVVEGVLRRTVGLTLEAEGCSAPVGSHCEVIGDGGRRIDAEVVGFAGERLYLMPAEPLHGIAPNARVVPIGDRKRIAVGSDMLGRVVDGRGRPLDGGKAIRGEGFVDLNPDTINPLQRQPIAEPLDVGVRAINALLPIGRGQRMGLFAGSGVGKSMLLGMMTRFTEADIIVVGLIGERGREVKEFVDETLGDSGLSRAVVVASPADDPPLMRLQGASLATAIAEYFRDQGKRVLLLMDSLTRYAQAQREIALAIGEPPATKGYPPSVFAKLPQLVERAGNGAKGGGSITAIYTVLAEGDDQNDPIVDAARAILDGHIVLSRRLAEGGHYPAIDVEASVSRAMMQITDETQRSHTLSLRQNYSLYQQNADLLAIGAYQPGSKPDVDAAIGLWPRIQNFLKQRPDEQVTRAESLAALGELLSAPTEVTEHVEGDHA